MHVRELVVLAGLVAQHAPTLFLNEASEPLGAAGRSWVAMRCRLDRWLLEMKRFQRHTESASRSQRTLQWESLRPVLEEIFVSEVLTRVWTAFCIVRDKTRNQQELEPSALSSQTGHLEARKRALQFVVQARGANTRQAVELNKIRRRAERWSDMLCASLIVEHDLYNLAFNKKRVRDFAIDFQKPNHTSSPMWQLVSVSISGAFQSGLAEHSPSEDWNHKIAAAILECFGSDNFNSFGKLKSPWVMRMGKTADDAQGWINELLDFDAAEISSASSRFDIG